MLSTDGVGLSHGRSYLQMYSSLESELNVRLCPHTQPRCLLVWRSTRAVPPMPSEGPSTIVVSGAAAVQRSVECQAVPGYPRQGACLRAR
jgi:hypothetical protein